MISSEVVRTASGPSIGELLNPLRMMRNLWDHRNLMLQLAKRDIQGRYRAAQLGLLWSILTPLVLLGIYTFVFTVGFHPRGSDHPTSRAEFALTLFAGMLLFNFFSEMTNR